MWGVPRRSGSVGHVTVVCDDMARCFFGYTLKWPPMPVGAGQSLYANAITPRNEGWEHSQPAFEVAHLAAGGSRVKDASGGPAGSQTFEKFDKQVLGIELSLTSNQRRM